MRMEMDARQFADMLEGREYGNEMTKAESKHAKDCGLLVAFGASDDNLELRGVIDDEFSAYDGIKLRVRMDKMEAVDEDTCPDCLARTKVIEINAEWCPKDFKGSWRITPSASFAAFDIMEDGELFCRGAVIDVKAVTP